MPHDRQDALKKNIERTIRKNALEIASFAELVGVSPRTMYNVRGNQPIGDRIVARVARFLGVDAESLYDPLFDPPKINPPKTAASLSPDLEEVLAILGQMPDDVRRHYIDLGRAIIERRDKKSES